jgi:hypothetical protein
MRGFVPAHDALLVREGSMEGDWATPLKVGRVAEAAGIMGPGQLIEFAYAYVGLESAAAVAVDTMRARVARNPQWIIAPCIVLLDRARRGDTVGVRASARELARKQRDDHRLGICPAMVEAFVESHDTVRSDTPALDSLEAIMRLAPGMEWPAPTGMLVVSRLARQRGQLARAYGSVRDACCWGWAFSRNARAAYLKEEGVLGVMMGDTAGAIRALTRYLNIRVDPDSGVVQSEVDSVRAALEVLQRDWSGRD